MSETKASPVPTHRFERQQQFRKNAKGDLDIAYVLIPKTDPVSGVAINEEYMLNGVILKRPIMIEDKDQPIYLDVLFVRPHGSKDEYGYDAEECIGNWERQANMAEPLMDKEFVSVFRRNYEAFKSGRAPVVNGTSIENWDEIPLPMRSHLVQNGVSSVEQLASANEQMMAQIGPAGRALKNRATEWLDNHHRVEMKVVQAQASVTNEIVKAQAEAISDLKDMVSMLLAEVGPAREALAKKAQKKAEMAKLSAEIEVKK